jgi:TonB family protein
MGKRRQHGLAFLPGLLLLATLVHGSFLWVANAWYIWKLEIPEDKELTIDLSDYTLEEVALVEEPPKPVEPETVPPKKPEDEVVEEKKTEKPRPELLKPEEKKLPKPEVAKLKPPPPPPEKKKPVPPPPTKTAEVKPLPKPVVPPPPPPPPPPPEVAKVPAPKPPKPKKMERHKMIEVDDEKNVVEEPPPDVNYLSDKNRRPDKETVARDTNLEKTEKGKQQASSKSNEEADKAGGKEDKVAQTEDSEASKLNARRDKIASVHRGKSDHAEGIKVGDKGERGEGGKGGEGGQGGQGGSGGENGTPGALSMRDAKGIGMKSDAPSPTPAPAGIPDDSPIVASSQNPGGKEGLEGDAGSRGRAGKAGKKGPKLQLQQQDYTRIVGQDKAEEEVAIAARKKSSRKGKWDKKLAKIQSTLETFTPEVRPGNQTALGTRADPFAVYIARMHNRIHEVWGFGFLADLDRKPQSNPMNDRTLEVTMEIVVAPDGDVSKVTIVRPSGVLTFDVAAVDTVMSLGPYQETPKDIRSGDGNVYLHWTFHRDERMCTPYFADPFILDNGGPGTEGSVEEHAEERGLPTPGENRAPPRQLSRSDGTTPRGTKGAVERPHVTREQLPSGDAAANQVAKEQLASPEDPRANDAAIAWGDAFEKGDLAALMAVSAAPFHSRGQVVAQDDGALAAVWRVVLNETEKRRIAEWQLLSPAGYRAAFGHLPEGAEDGTHTLYLVARIGKDLLTLEVTQQTDGSYKVTGLTR